jgi:hypothetical protein
MDHNESLRKFEQLMLKQVDHAHHAATELEGLVLLMPSEKSRQLAQLQVKASHKQAKEFREPAQQVREI